MVYKGWNCLIHHALGPNVRRFHSTRRDHLHVLLLSSHSWTLRCLAEQDKIQVCSHTLFDYHYRFDPPTMVIDIAFCATRNVNEWRSVAKQESYQWSSPFFNQVYSLYSTAMSSK